MNCCNCDAGCGGGYCSTCYDKRVKDIQTARDFYLQNWEAAADELKALRAERTRYHAAVTDQLQYDMRELLDGTPEHRALIAWREATGCDTPEEAREAIIVDATALAPKLAVQKIAEQEAELARLRDENASLPWLRGEYQLAQQHRDELALLRELREAVLDREDGLVVDSRRLPAAIAACRAAKEVR